MNKRTIVREVDALIHLRLVDPISVRLFNILVSHLAIGKLHDDGTTYLLRRMLNNRYDD